MIQMEKEPGKRTSRKSMEKAKKRLIMFQAERSQNIFRDIYVYNISKTYLKTYIYIPI